MSFRSDFSSILFGSGRPSGFFAGDSGFRAVLWSNHADLDGRDAIASSFVALADLEWPQITPCFSSLPSLSGSLSSCSVLSDPVPINDRVKAWDIAQLPDDWET